MSRKSGYRFSEKGHAPLKEANPLLRSPGEATIGAEIRRSRALLDPSYDQAAGLVRLPALHAGIRYVQSRLSVDEGRAGVHAAAGPAPGRGLYAAGVAGPLRRREHPQGDLSRIRV